MRGEYEEEHHAFVLLGTGSPVTPVPEPRTYAMVLSSLAMFRILRRRATQQGTA